jgi:hypothetical protein
MHLEEIFGVDPDAADKNDGSSPQPSQGKKKMKPADDVVSLGDLISDIQDVFDDASKNWKKHESEIMSALVVVDHVSLSPLSPLPAKLLSRSSLGNGKQQILPKKTTLID